jgi:hypothetical protein
MASSTNISYGGSQWRIHWLDGDLEDLQLNSLAFSSRLTKNIPLALRPYLHRSASYCLALLQRRPGCPKWSKVESIQTLVVAAHSGSQKERMHTLAALLWAAYDSCGCLKSLAGHQLVELPMDRHGAWPLGTMVYKESPSCASHIGLLIPWSCD